jgi:hypothetical protein
MTELIYTCSVLSETTRGNHKDRLRYNYAFEDLRAAFDTEGLKVQIAQRQFHTPVKQDVKLHT